MQEADSAELAVATSSGEQDANGETLGGRWHAYPSGEALTGNLGSAAEFTGAEVIDEIQSGQTNRYAFAIDDLQLRSTGQQVVWVRATVERYRSTFLADTPTIAGLEPIARSVDGDQTVALFAIERPDQYLLEIRGADADESGRYRLRLDVVGDLNHDGVVDGFDSQLLSQSLGSFVQDREYSAAADLDSDGAITAADSQLLAANFGFSTTRSAIQFVDRFATDSSLPVHTPPGGLPTLPPVDPPVDPSTGAQTRVTLPPLPDPTTDPPELTTPSLVPIGDATFGIRDGGFEQGTNWTVTGDVGFENGTAILSESDDQRTSLRQAFYVPANASLLRFTVSGLQLDHAERAAPDAFEVALLDAVSLAPLTSILSSGNSDALLNFAADGTYRSAAGVVVGSVGSDDPTRDLAQNWSGAIADDDQLLVQIDLSSVAPGTLAMLSLDLLGFADRESQLVIDDVAVLAGPLRSPVANTDLVTTSEDMAVNIFVLANDSDSDSSLDSTSVVITSPPNHGQLFQNDSGVVTYSPEPDYSGSDSFTYTVRDTDGFVSGEAFVSIEITAVTDTPHLQVAAIRGPQDTPLGIQIDADSTDRDGSEQVSLIVDQLPNGATLDRGTRIADGVYSLTAEQWDGVHLVPSSGWSGQAEVRVAVTAIDQDAKAVVTERNVLLDVSSVVVNPMSIAGFEVNHGEEQRTLLHTLSVTFNQDAWIVDPTQDVFVSDIDGNQIQIPPDHFHYDSQTFTLTIDVEGLIEEDDQYYLMLRSAGIASNANRLQTMATGPDSGVEYLPLPFHRLLGDVNGNNEVDNGDWQIIRQSLLTNTETPGYVRERDLTGEGIINVHDFVAWRNRRGVTTDHQPPQIIAGITLPENRVPLVNAFQSDAELSVVIDDASEISTLTVSVNGTEPQSLVGQLNEAGSLVLPLANLFSQHGQSLSETQHVLTLVGADRFGNTTEPLSVDFTIDETAPAVPTDSGVDRCGWQCGQRKSSLPNRGCWFGRSEKPTASCGCIAMKRPSH